MAVQKSYKERLADIAKHRAEMKKARAKKKAEKAAKKVAKQKAKNVKKISKMATKAEKKEKGAGLKSVSIGKKSDPSKLSPTGKLRKGMKGVEVTEGGAYAKYGKKSKPAKSFREAFAKARKEKGSGKTFTWDGRSYSTNTADDVKKEKAAKAKSKMDSEKRDRGATNPDQYAEGGKVESGGGMFNWPSRDARNGGKK